MGSVCTKFSSIFDLAEKFRYWILFQEGLPNRNEKSHMRSFWRASLRYLVFDFFATSKILKMVWILGSQMQSLPKGNLTESRHWFGWVLFAQKFSSIFNLAEKFRYWILFQEGLPNRNEKSHMRSFWRASLRYLVFDFFATSKILKMVWILGSQMQSLPKGNLTESRHWFGWVLFAQKFSSIFNLAEKFRYWILFQEGLPNRNIVKNVTKRRF